MLAALARARLWLSRRRRLRRHGAFGQADHDGGAVPARACARSRGAAGRRASLPTRSGRPVVVENRTGANGTHRLQRGRARGARRLIRSSSPPRRTHVTAVHLMKSLPYDPVKDFTPIVAAVEPVTCLVVNSALPVNSVAELVAYAKRAPGRCSATALPASARCFI